MNQSNLRLVTNDNLLAATVATALEQHLSEGGVTFDSLMLLLRRRALAAGAALASGAFVRYAVAEPERKSWRDSLTFKPCFYGQLAPPVPTEAQAASNGQTACGPVLCRRGLVAQKGPYGGLWLRVGCPGAPPPDAGALAAELDSMPKASSAVYVALNERCVSPGLTEALLSRGFRFHHYRHANTRGTQAHNELVYYKWEGDPAHDMVPAYATATEGVGGVVLSSDEKSVLLVWEYGCWKLVTGSLDPGEPVLTALRREALEEVGIELDPS